MKTALAALLALTMLAGCKPAEPTVTEPTKDKPATTGAGASASTAGATTGTNPLVTQRNLPTAPAIGQPTSTDAAPTAEMKRFFGKYNGKIVFTKATIDALKKMVPPAQYPQIDQHVAEAKKAVITLDLNADGGYVAVTTAQGKTQKETGKWTYDTATKSVVFKDPDITPEQIAEMKGRGVTDQQIAEARKKEQNLTVSKDGKTLTLATGQGPTAVDIVFTKK